LIGIFSMWPTYPAKFEIFGSWLASMVRLTCWARERSRRRLTSVVGWGGFNTSYTTI